MMKLMKYELLRRKQLLIGAALSIVFLEGVALLGLFLGGGWNALARHDGAAGRRRVCACVPRRV